MYQRVDDRLYVAHPIETLAVTDPLQFLGKTVDVHYPCNKVGLLQAIDDLKADHARLQLPDKAHSNPIFER